MKTSAGLLLYRVHGQRIEVLLVHPGGPYWKNKDEGAWSIPKGEFEQGDDPLAAARREFVEETGTSINGAFAPLTPIKQPGGKVVYAWSVEGDLDAEAIRSNSFSMEWPPRSGVRREFPEVDRAAWFSPEDARRKILRGQRPLLDEFYREFSAARFGNTSSVPEA